MDATSMVIGLIAGGIIGGIIGHLMSRSNFAKTEGELKAKSGEVSQLNERIASMNIRIDELNKSLNEETEKRASSESTSKLVPGLEEQITSLRDETSRQKVKLAEISESLSNERKAAAEKIKLLEDARTNLSDAFKALSDDALKSNNQAFLILAKTMFEKVQTEAKGDLKQRQTAIQSLVDPLRESLERYEKQVTDMGKERSGQYKSLVDQLKSLLESEKALTTETGKLVSALSAPKVRGQWGQITLRRVAELAGMVERCDFFEEVSIEGDKGRLRPDMIVELPNGRRIVVDAKAVLKAYLEALESPGEAERTVKLKEHAKQIRSRVMDLSRKEYWDQFDKAPEFVVLFLPGEQFLGAALQEDPDLLEDAFKQKVILATPTTLIALLKAIAYGWRQESLQENAQKISELGKLLYERINSMAGHFADLGKKLDGSVKSYNSVLGSLERRVLVSTRKFKELGATGAGDIPEIDPVDSTPRTLPEFSQGIEDSATPPEQPTLPPGTA